MSTFAVLFAALLCGMASASFKCRRIQHNPDANTILNLTNIISLEGLAFDFCKQANCSDANAICGATKGVLGGNAADGVLGTATGVLSGGLGGRRRRSDGLLGGLTGGKKDDGLLGGVTGAVSDLVCNVGDLAGKLGGKVVEALQCLIDPNHDGKNPNKVTPFQTCIVGSILELNLLETCDVQAIIRSLTTICPKGDIHNLAISACLCCTPEEESIEVCVNAALGSKGLKVDIKPANIGILGNALGGQNGTNVVKTGDYVSKGGKSGKKEGLLVNLLSEDGLKVGEIQVLGSATNSKDGQKQQGSSSSMDASGSVSNGNGSASASSSASASANATSSN